MATANPSEESEIPSMQAFQDNLEALGWVNDATGTVWTKISATTDVIETDPGSIVARRVNSVGQFLATFNTSTDITAVSFNPLIPQ